MTLLHMQTEQVRSTGIQLQCTIEEMREQMQGLYQRVLATEWQGPNRDDFVWQFARLARSWNNLMDEKASC